MTFHTDEKLRAVASAWAEERRFIESLTVDERSAVGNHEGWSAKGSTRWDATLPAEIAHPS